MVKTRYWVSVGRQEVVPKIEATTNEQYEFEIEADNEDLLRLDELFAELSLADKQLVNRARTPYEAFPEKDQDMKNHSYDDRLKDIYFYIHQLGVPETRQHIEEMNLGDFPQYQNMNDKTATTDPLRT
ncbi:hypothetical protein D3C73_393340 [compost metagenome]